MTSCLTAWSCVASGGFCVWFRVPSGGLPSGGSLGSSLSRLGSLQGGGSVKGVSVQGGGLCEGGLCEGWSL